MLHETERAQDELGGRPGDVELYKSIGSLLVSGDKERVMEELRDQKETVEIRVKTLTKQAERLTGRLTTLREQAAKGLKALGYETR